MQKSNNGEQITWIIADHGWSDLNRSEFEKTANRKNVESVFVSNKDELINYINNKDKDVSGMNISSSRSNDPITNISVFSHGLARDNEVISLGYVYTGNYPTNLDISVGDLNNINAHAFSNPNSSFYSCNTGTAGQESFAQEWVNMVGGITTAFYGKSDYTNCADTSFFASIARNFIELIYGVSAYGGNTTLPVAGTDATQLTFYGESCE